MLKKGICYQCNKPGNLNVNLICFFCHLKKTEKNMSDTSRKQFLKDRKRELKNIEQEIKNDELLKNIKKKIKKIRGNP